MTELERQEARRLARVQESLKDPAMKAAYEYSQRKIQEDKRREEILKNWGANGCYIPPEIRNPQPRPMTEEEKRIDDLVRNFG